MFDQTLAWQDSIVRFGTAVSLLDEFFQELQYLRQGLFVRNTFLLNRKAGMCSFLLSGAHACPFILRSSRCGLRKSGDGHKILLCCHGRRWIVPCFFASACSFVVAFGSAPATRLPPRTGARAARAVERVRLGLSSQARRCSGLESLEGGIMDKSVSSLRCEVSRGRQAR